jgi:hypothetical protein
LTQPGREEFVLFKIAAVQFNFLKANYVIPRERDKLCAFWATANQTSKDALCTAAGRSAGCLMCP